ncbi:Uncharacterised protein [Streptococcus pneumoniae]|nr:Uncharacterised protein [Streptococcus pneumoniae]CJQ04810.1 Uncharacterised protein [Streptococcus pneumoniae]
MVLVQNKKVRTVTLEKVAFLYTLSTNPTPPKNISTIIQLYRPQLRIYRRFDTTYRLTDKFRKKQRQNHQPIPHQHPRPYKRKKHQVPPVLFPHSKTNDKPPHAPSQSRPSSVLPARIFQWRICSVF